MRGKIQLPVGNVLSQPAIMIRDLESIEDLRQIPDVEKEVWGSDDRDTVPVLLLIAAREAGSILLGAFDDQQLIGFAFGFPGLEHGQVSIHSHMTAVLPPTGTSIWATSSSWCSASEPWPQGFAILRGPSIPCRRATHTSISPS